jgi:hypothetical protein
VEEAGSEGFIMRRLQAVVTGSIVAYSKYSIPWSNRKNCKNVNPRTIVNDRFESVDVL